MPKVFVHGNPETAAVWEPLLAELERTGVPRAELICLSPPGFGAPVPDGFGATAREYRDWLASELVPGEPVDLVGHDAGGSHVVNLVLRRPDLVRSWVSDTLGTYDREYRWHALARRWQTPDVGEADIATRFGGTVRERAAVLVQRGMNQQVASRVAAGQDAAMGRSVLALYRSNARPGLAILATEDHFVGTDEQRHRAAARAGARVEVLSGLGHWWMTQDPVRGAAALRAFWATV
jgi:pimeloyl-ACP methyl ester carboxylesterase